MTIPLVSNRPANRFYRGGSRIAAFRGEADAAPYEPEDWVASTTTVFGEQQTGLSRLPGGRLLRDAVREAPAQWLGVEHAFRWGSDIRLLVKLLDAGQRLPVHAHPDDHFALQQLGHEHGKAEAWYILEGGTVHVGLRRAVLRSELDDLVARQDADALLALLHPIVVVPGDVVWVPPGELHAIGEGVFLVEVQQPEDLSILLEWRDFAIDGAASGHLGIGFDRALAAVNLRPRTPVELRELVFSAAPSGQLLPPDAERYFRLERIPVDGPGLIDAGFAVIVVTDGVVVLGGRPTPRGATHLLPAAGGPLAVDGHGELLVARPPAPSIRL
ncbi:carbohydrate kinase [Homoserinibacter sp. GY 40078]|uniref:carbohydrate kinase n=1 Tax=Homoserinibacter sp. GY 40078 TaxID=2603275 RepID=UPI0011CA9476|nr:carbohydrate kinase [Homoserinibacter sp. GY 40078]TXK17440.1 carbohydrate kinase [Homoserinibacter sp. GY 40078]